LGRQARPFTPSILKIPFSWARYLFAYLSSCALGLSAISQQYFSLRTNQQSATSTFLSQQISSSHQQPAKRTGCMYLVGQVPSPLLLLLGIVEHASEHLAASLASRPFHVVLASSADAGSTALAMQKLHTNWSEERRKPHTSCLRLSMDPGPCRTSRPWRKAMLVSPLLRAATPPSGVEENICAAKPAGRPPQLPGWIGADRDFGRAVLAWCVCVPTSRHANYVLPRNCFDVWPIRLAALVSLPFRRRLPLFLGPQQPKDQHRTGVLRFFLLILLHKLFACAVYKSS
jgi:hypothetical protein